VMGEAITKHERLKKKKGALPINENYGKGGGNG